MKSRGYDSANLLSSELPSGRGSAPVSPSSRSSAVDGQSQQTPDASTDKHVGIVVTIDAGPHHEQLCVTNWQPIYSYEQPDLSQLPIPVSVACVE